MSLITMHELVEQKEITSAAKALFDQIAKAAFTQGAPQPLLVEIRVRAWSGDDVTLNIVQGAIDGA